jgi:SAM-dependent methyltransferase
MQITADVPCPIDYLQVEEARKWADHATERRPWRADMLRALAKHVADLSHGRPVRLLELGSGPGFLAQEILAIAPEVNYVGLDVSAAMHYLSKERNSQKAGKIQLIERSFKSGEWSCGLGIFDLVVTNQAVHELRHKRHAATLHKQVAELLAPGGAYLVSDHFLGEGAMTNAELYMTQDEQLECLLEAGFNDVKRLFQIGDLVLHKAT